MRSVLKACLTLSLALELVTPGYAQTKADEGRIRAIAAHWERAWNTHDMEALAALITSDADFVNVGARHWKGRNEIRAQHAARLSQYMDSVWTTAGITVQFLERDVALVHIAWGMRGDKDPDGAPRQPREGLFTWVVVRQGEDWLVRAAQNTNRGNLPPPRDASTPAGRASRPQSA